MDASEYINTVTGQMRCRKARAMVAKELSDHITDQTDAYLEEGMSPKEAASEAVRQMGDAVEVGTELDRLHRPRLDKKTLIAVGILSLAAIFLQSIVQQELRHSGILSASAWLVPVQVLTGVLIMTGILFLDYTFLGKHPLVPWLVLLGIQILFGYAEKFAGINAFYRWINGSPWYWSRVSTYFLLGLFLPAFTGVIYYYRKKGWRGLFCSVLWLVIGAAIYMTTLNRMFLGLMVCFAGLLLVTYALARGWYGIPKVPAVCVLWGVLLVIGVGFFLYLSVGNHYMMERLKYFYDFLTVGSDRNGMNYLQANIRDKLGEVALWGRGGEWSGYPVESAMSLFLILNKMGILPMILIALAFLVLLVCMVAGVSRQKKVLGGLLGMACILSLLIPAIAHVLSNLIFIPYTDVYIPFLYPGWVANGVSYTLLGLYLSVYRYTDVVA